MKNWLALLAVLLVANVSAADNTYRGTMDGLSNHPPDIIYHELTFDANTTDSRPLNVGTYCSAIFVDGAGGDVAMWEVPTSSTAASSGTLRTTFTGTTNVPYTWSPGKGWIKFVPSTSALSAVVTVTCSGGIASGRGGGDPDPDGDGLVSWAYLDDADGDGSTWQTCTAKDTPDVRCKALGERIYPDFADDINCKIWGGAGCVTAQMEKDGTIYLEEGVYALFPCWRPGGPNQPGAANDDAHDSTVDAAWSDCPATPDPDTTRRFYTVALMDWQGEIIGAGTDTRDPKTSGYIRNQGTYIVNDMGPSWNAGTQANNNTWFSSTSFIRGINIGFEPGAIASSSAGTNSGELGGDGDSKGYGTISGTVLMGLSAANQVICIANTSGLDTLVAGDIVEIKSTSGQSASLSSTTNTTAFRVRATPDTVTTCNGAGTFYLALGGIPGYLGTTGQYYVTSAPYTYQYTNGMQITAARSDYLDSRARITNLNIESQDPWDESGGDCNQVTTTSTNNGAGSGLWTQLIDGNTDGSHSADIDCDTEPLVGLWGGGTPLIEDVVIRGWHDYAIDGASNSGSPLVSRVRFFGGHGGPIMDMGSGWRANDIEIRDSQFNTSAISTFGPGLSVEHARFYNVAAYQVAALTETAVGDYFNDIKIENSAITRAFLFQDGARYNTLRHIWMSNLSGVGKPVSSFNGFIAHFNCTGGASNACEGNVIDDWYLEVAKSTAMLPTGATAVGILYDAGVTIANAATNNPGIVRNVTTNGRIRSRYTGINVCAVGAVDSDTSVDASDRFRAGVPFDYSHEDVLNTNIHSNLSAYASGGGGATDLVFCGCNINKSGGGGAGWGTCETPYGGSAGGGGIGADPRGCGNMDNTSAPAIGSCT